MRIGRGARSGLGTLLIAAALAAVFTRGAGRVEAHRLERLLQATLIAVDLDRVRLEINLTPGVDVAPGLISKMDRDHDGRISPAEGKVWLHDFARDLELKMDQKKANLRLLESWFPLTEAMAGGLGTIRLVFEATIPGSAAGRHELYFRSHFETNRSDYLVNALVPASPRIKIKGQRRDESQMETRIEYTVTAEGAGGRLQ